MRISELFFPSDAPRLRPGMHKISTLPIDSILNMVKTMHDSGKDYRSIFDAVKREFGPEAKAYVVKNIASMVNGSLVNEEFWAYPHSGDQMKTLKSVLSTCTKPDDAKTKLKNVLSSKYLFDMIDALGQEEDAVPIIVGYIKVQYPQLSQKLNKQDIEHFKNRDGIMSPLSSPDGDRE